MKYSFSTSACPNQSFDRIVNSASKLGFDGIEINGIGNETYIPNTPEFSNEYLHQTLALLKASKLEIPVLSTRTVLSDTKDKVRVIQEPYEYIDLAQRANIKYIRVRGDKRLEPSINDNIDISFTLENLKQICSYAMPKEIEILIETSGFFSDSRLLARLIRDLDCKNLGVLWDINHTVRYSFEKPEQTVAVFGDKLKHVHVKDSVINNGNLEYRPMGRGDLPLSDAITALKKAGYNGYLSLDWPKRMNPELLDSETILPQFLYYIKNIID